MEHTYHDYEPIAGLPLLTKGEGENSCLVSGEEILAPALERRKVIVALLGDLLKPSGDKPLAALLHSVELCRTEKAEKCKTCIIPFSHCLSRSLAREKKARARVRV